MEAAETCTMRIEAALGNEPAVQRFLTEALETTECPPKARKELRLAVEELFVNVARYAYDPGSGEETPIGGLGIMMVKRLMDAHSYRYVDGCNEVTIAKRW